MTVLRMTKFALRGVVEGKDVFISLIISRFRVDILCLQSSLDEDLYNK